MTTAAIEVRTVGQAFGCEALVYVHGKPVHLTRVYPHGQRANAWHAAADWCRERGYDPIDAESGEVSR